MRIVIGGDHAGFHLKERLAELLRQAGHEVEDVGSHSAEPVDFPDIAQQVCAEVVQGRAERAVMVCGTGVGAAIAANKVPGIRAAVCHDAYSAHQAVEHDDVNVLCLGAQIVGDRLASELLTTYLAAEHSTEPHFRRRVAKLHELDMRGRTPRGGSDQT
jgi:ribose 5-phosphate isomerase B